MLWRCVPQSAWITESACMRLRTLDPKPVAAPIDSHFPMAVRFTPCAGCPGVRTLHAQGAPAPKECSRVSGLPLPRSL